MLQTSVKPKTFTLRDSGHKVYRWSFFKLSGLWYLTDHTGYTRTLESTWDSSVYRIRMIAENHGMVAEID